MRKSCKEWYALGLGPRCWADLESIYNQFRWLIIFFSKTHWRQEAVKLVHKVFRRKRAYVFPSCVHQSPQFCSRCQCKSQGSDTHAKKIFPGLLSIYKSCAPLVSIVSFKMASYETNLLLMVNGIKFQNDIHLFLTLQSIGDECQSRHY